MTSYHLLSNGIVDCFQRQLKATFRIWPTFLVRVLLSWRTAIKSELDYFSAELLYDTTLVLPGTIFVPTKSSCSDTASYISRLRFYFAKLPPKSPRNQIVSSYIPMDINDWTHIFVRGDSVHGPLNTPYKGPFHVLTHSSKTFKLDINRCTKIVSVDHLKKHLKTVTMFLLHLLQSLATTSPHAFTST